MGRMFFSVFYGEPDPQQQPHESGGWMLLPLVVLAVLSAVGGIVPFALGFGDWVRFGPAHHTGINWAIAGSSTLLSIAALALAWQMYGSKQLSADTVARKLPWLYTLSLNKFFVDEFYSWIRKVFVDGVGAVLYWIDVNIIDGLVNNLSRSVAGGSGLVRKLQSGKIQQYALVYFAAAIVLVVWLGGVR
jgi:NADH-quinone oxidoreductase subunit L